MERYHPPVPPKKTPPPPAASPVLPQAQGGEAPKAPGTAPVPGKGGNALDLGPISAFFRDDPLPATLQYIDEAEARGRYKALLRTVQLQTWVILGAAALILFMIPILQPINNYIAMRPDKMKKPLVALIEPNQTDQAVLSWAATSITEIMTFGFGDFDARILGQRHRFTDEGWESFVEAVIKKQMRESFMKQQLVLTTAPRGAPVITSKGTEADGIYRWVVEMPVIMTYTTNNKVSEAKRGIVRLTIVRVPARINQRGIGIKTWVFT